MIKIENFSIINSISMVLGVISVYLLATIRYYNNYEETTYGHMIFEKLLENMPSDKIKKYIGDQGELETFQVLHNTLLGKARIFNSVYVEPNTKNSGEIDFVISYDGGLMVIENKNWSGKIEGNKDDNYWKLFKENDKYGKDLYNPIKQNEGHIKKLKKVIAEDLLKEYEIEYQISDSNIYSTIVFGYKSNIESVKIEEENLKILNTNELGEYLNSIIKNSEQILDENKIYKINEILKKYCEVDDETIQNHIDRLN